MMLTPKFLAAAALLAAAQLTAVAFAHAAGAAREPQRRFASAAEAMRADFARAERALALEHRAQAAEAWSHKRYKQAGAELKAAAGRLESAAAWTGGQAKAAAAAAVSDARALGREIANRG